MKFLNFGLLWGALIILASAQSEEDHREKRQLRLTASGWFWNSTTSTAAPITPNTESTLAPTTTDSTDTESTTVVLGEELLVLSDTEKDKDTQGRSPDNSEDFVPLNITVGRSSKALNLDSLELGGVREARIINEDPGNRRLTLQGFIPIISLSGKDEDSNAFLKKSQKRVQEDNLYYNGPYPPQPIEEEKEKTEQNYYLSGQYPPHPKPAQNPYDTERPKFDQDSQNQEFPAQSDGFGTRLKTGKALSSGSVAQNNHNFYIPPSKIEDSKGEGNVGSAGTKAVRYITSADYHNAYNKVPSSQQGYLPTTGNGHFAVDSKKPEEPVYVQAGPYPPESAQDDYPAYQGSKDTTAKQFRPPVTKQFDSSFDLAGVGYGFNPDSAFEDKCVCVPFYMCKNGYYNGRSSGPIEPIDERTPKKVTKRSAGNETSEDKKDKEEPVLYASDVSERQGINSFTQSCGLLRRCCRVPKTGIPGGLLPFSPDNYPIPPIAGFENLPPGLIPPGFQGLPGQEQNSYHRPSQDQHTILIQQEAYPQPGLDQEHVFVVPQEVRPHRRPKPLEHRPFYPQRKPVNPFPHNKPHRPYPQQQPHVIPPRPRPPTHHQPVYPHQKPHHQPTYPQPVYQPKPQPIYPQPKPVYPKPQPVYPQPQPAYPQPDYTQPKPQLHQGQCGARNGLGIHGRVKNLQYHDDASEFGEYPWQVAILLKVGPGNNLFVCGGTLISHQWVATAAHCLKKHQADELKVRLGDWDVHRDDEFYPYVETYVVEVVAHPEFYPGNLQNDIALLKLESPVDPSLPHISPACLPEPHERFDGERCWTTGWGKNAFGEQGEYQSVLKEVDVPVLSHRDCEHRLRQTRLGHTYQLHHGFVCAGGEPGKDACTGDGGSPLVCESHGTWKVAGLVSWGIGCGQPGVPGIYVNMAKYRVWMDNIVSSYG